MRTRWTCRGCDRIDQQRLEHLWETIRAPLDERLKRRPGNRVQLEIAADRNGDGTDWSFDAALFLPTDALAAHAATGRPEAGLQQIATELAGGLEASPLGQPRDRDGAALRRSFRTIAPALERFSRDRHGAAFLAFLRPLVRSLADYVRHELRLLVRERALPPAQVTATDVLDEALVRAWEGFDRRPSGLALDVWVVRLIDENLDEFARGAAHESIERRMPLPVDEPHSSWDDTWVARAGEPETIGFAELLPGRPGIDVWDRLDGETRQAALAELLGQLSRAQRQALIFHAVEGYDPAEIADFQDRPVDDVLEDIATARQILWHQTEAEDDLADIEQRFAETATRTTRRRRK
jgi:DNA-directed RNA polymerase specialized sigma24 family protein